MAAGDQTLAAMRVQLAGETNGVPRLLGSTLSGHLFTHAHPTLETVEDALANDSDKTFTVPAATQWWVHSIEVVFTSTASVGNRQLALLIEDSATIQYFFMNAGLLQTASLTTIYVFAPGLPHQTALINTQLLVPIPPNLLIGAAGTMRLVDTNGVDAAADDMTVRINRSTYAL